MANRCILHKTHLEDFKRWLIDNDWNLVDTKGDYEVLRAKKDGRQYPLIIFEKIDAKQHYSVMDRDVQVVKDYLAKKRREERMKQQTIICDKCKKVIDTKYDNYPSEVVLKNGSYVLDLCPSCYSKLLKIIGTWLKEKEGEK